MNTRFYSFTGVIYEDDENFVNQFSYLKSTQECIWIRHDNDVNDDGELKKPHYHFVLKLKNACTISALAKNSCIPVNLIEPIKKSFNGSLRYLIHYGYDDKFQYSVTDIECNSDKLKRRFDDLVSKDIPEVDKVISIQDYINTYQGVLTMDMLGRYVQKTNQWDAFRRNITFFKIILDEHNIGWRLY